MREPLLVLQFVGYSQSGKTTTIVELTKQLQADGYRVGVIKHDWHDSEWDQPGKDTWLFRQAGAPYVALQSATKTAWFVQESLSLDHMVKQMSLSGAEVILIEGFKQEKYPKIAVLRQEEEVQILEQLDNCLAIISRFPFSYEKLPVFFSDDYNQLYRYVKGLFRT